MNITMSILQLHFYPIMRKPCVSLGSVKANLDDVNGDYITSAAADTYIIAMRACQALLRQNWRLLIPEIE
jgi:hypothetical protein